MYHFVFASYRWLILLVAICNSTYAHFDVEQVWENYVVQQNTVVPSSHHIVMRQNVSIYGGLTIESGGMVTLDHEVGANLVVDFLDIHGKLQIVANEDILDKKVRITLACAGNRTLPPHDDRRKGVNVRAGGSIKLQGYNKGSWTKLAQSVASGADKVYLHSLNGLQYGDEIVIASTDFDPHQTEKRRVTGFDCGTDNASSNSEEVVCVSLDQPLQYNHHGAIHYGVDERGEVGILSRSITLDACVDVASNDNRVDAEMDYDGAKFGGHIKFTRDVHQVSLKGVEIMNFGQEDQIGRYPIHFHLTGYMGNDTFLQGCSIHDSIIRGIVLHGTQNVVIDNNVVANVSGHAVYLEDGAEYHNIFSHNLIVLVKERHKFVRLGSEVGGKGISGFWLTHPSNTLINNVVAGVEKGAGFWLHVRVQVKGLSAETGMYNEVKPFVASFGKMIDNAAHSCSVGINLETLGISDEGDSHPDKTKASPSNYVPPGPEPPLINGFRVYKAHRGGWFRMYELVARNFFIADVSEGIQMLAQGNTPEGHDILASIENSVIVGTTPNIGTMRASKWQKVSRLRNRTESIETGDQRMGIVLYDGPITLNNITFASWEDEESCFGKVSPAIGARSHNIFVMATSNALKDNKIRFVNTAYRYHISDRSADGGKTSSLYDQLGSISGYMDSTILPDWQVYATPLCQRHPTYGLACPHRYSNLDIIADRTAHGNMVLTRRNFDGNSSESRPYMTFHGDPIMNSWLYHPIISEGAAYILHFESYTPDNLTIVLSNAKQGEIFDLTIVYPKGTKVQSVTSSRAADKLSQAVHGFVDTCVNCFHYEEERDLLHIRMQQIDNNGQNNRVCPNSGCPRFSIQAHVPQNSGISWNPDMDDLIFNTGENVGLQIDSSDRSSSWLNTDFPSNGETIPVLERTGLCALNDSCLNDVGLGNLQNGILAFEDEGCSNGGLGCFSDKCRYCHLGVNSPFVPCPFNQSLDELPVLPTTTLARPDSTSTSTSTTAIPMITNITAAVDLKCEVSSGDRHVGIDAFHEEECVGLGCFTSHGVSCRFCRKFDTPASAHLLECPATLKSDASMTSTTGPPAIITTGIDSTESPNDGNRQDGNLLHTVAPINMSLGCHSLVSAGDIQLGVSALFDLSCSKADDISTTKGCFPVQIPCRYCKYLESEWSAMYESCQSARRLKSESAHSIFFPQQSKNLLLLAGVSLVVSFFMLTTRYREKRKRRSVVKPARAFS